MFVGKLSSPIFMPFRATNCKEFQLRRAEVLDKHPRRLKIMENDPEGVLLGYRAHSFNSFGVILGFTLLPSRRQPYCSLITS